MEERFKGIIRIALFIEKKQVLTNDWLRREKGLLLEVLYGFI